jgi:hypothetical protein
VLQRLIRGARGEIDNDSAVFGKALQTEAIVNQGYLNKREAALRAKGSGFHVFLPAKNPVE